jgi:serine/threonine-protein kinase
MTPKEDTADPAARDETLEELSCGVVATQPLVLPELPGRYEDLGPIAAGSFGEVRRVRDTLFDRVIAMKLLRPEHARAPRVRRRFLVEAQITAGLQHPGIVAVHDRGELADGRLWFTMKEVRGRTLGEVIRELHGNKSAEGFGDAPSGLTFRRLVDAFARIAHAIAYAHSRGVVHRDLKPENLMVGEFGEVLVMDWGLARQIGSPDEENRGAASSEPSAMLTHHGDILGTPAFMAPEQAFGETALHGPASDIYSLGAVLHCLLTGRPPYQGTLKEVLSALRHGPGRGEDHAAATLTEAMGSGPPVPAELSLVCARAMQRAIADRYASADALAADVVAWLDGARRREQALAALENARALEPAIAELRGRAELAQAGARALMADLKPFDPIEKKRPAWSLEDEAARLGRAAALAQTTWTEAVQGALTADPELPDAHALLADHYRERLVSAELQRRDEEAASAQEMLRVHDRGRHAAFLRGDGALTLVTDPAGAEAWVARFEPQDRRLSAVQERMLGVTPLVEVPLARGSYLLRIRSPGRVEVRVPVLIERAGHWDGCAPSVSGEQRAVESTPVWLPHQSELGADDIYVPAGWCVAGGDPDAADSLPRSRVWVDAFVIRRFPVTTAEYLDYLNDLVREGREAEALARCPRVQLGLAQGGDDLALTRDAAGAFGLPADREGLRWRADWPVVLVDWHSAMGYASWLASRTGQPWRLLNDLEREKAARGVDGRFFPWGDHADPTFARVIDSSADEPSRGSVTGHPVDESPYGVRGLAGNTRDWCINAWKLDGPLVSGSRLLLDAADLSDPEFRAIRGGAWASAMTYSRSAARFGGRPEVRRPLLGVRVGRTYVPVTAGRRCTTQS